MCLRYMEINVWDSIKNKGHPCFSIDTLILTLLQNVWKSLLFVMCDDVRWQKFKKAIKKGGGYAFLAGESIKKGC